MQEQGIGTYEDLQRKAVAASNEFNTLSDETVDAFIAELGKQDGLILGFDERLFCSLVDYATVYSENDVRFTFKDGTEM